MDKLELDVNKYLAPVIETVATQDVDLEELVVACFHCDPAAPSSNVSLLF
ncbi:MAG: hypothetical protein ACI4TA_07710 [Acetatifactor sp.]